MADDEDNDNAFELPKPTPTLMGLPEEIRLHLLEKYICNPLDNLRLRKVCHRLKDEIDLQIGIRSQITFTNSLEDPQLFSFLSHTILRRVHINGSLCPPKILFKFEEIISHPFKLEFLLITGGFWYQFLTETVLQKCLGIRKLELHCFLFQNAMTHEHSFPTKSSDIHLPLLNDLSLITEPYPPLQAGGEESIQLYRKHCKTPLHFIQSLSAPQLKRFRLKIKYVSGVVLDILDLLEYSIISFISRHGNLQSVLISVEKSGRGDSNIDPAVNEFGMGTSLQLVTTLDDLDEESSLQEKMKKCMSRLPDLQNLEEFKFQLDSESGHEKLLDLIQNRSIHLKDFGLKVKSRLIHFNSQLLPVLEANNALTKIFIFCGFKPSFPILGGGDEIEFRNWINFRIFTECPNLEVISFHEDVPNNWSQSERTLLRNVGTGVIFLKKLKVLILDGFILDAADLEVLSTFLRVTNTNKSLEVVGITQASLGLSMLESINDETLITGVTFPCFINLLTNRRLNALLLSMDSVIVGNFREGLVIEKMREAITGQFRSLMLDLSCKDCVQGRTCKDCAGGRSFHYWKTSFLGFSVSFDPFQEY